MERILKRKGSLFLYLDVMFEVRRVWLFWMRLSRVWFVVRFLEGLDGCVFI